MKSIVFIVCTITFLSGHLNAQYSNHKLPDFRKADSVAALYPNHSLTDLRLLSEKLTGALSTEEEKFRSLYKWVCDNIENDYSLYELNKRKREKLRPAEIETWNKTFAPRVLRTLVESHRTVCSGYAYLIKELASYAGITCEVVHGYGRNTQANIGGKGIVNHSWNAVKLHDQWYLCDPTWSSGGLDIQRQVFIRKYNDAYFLADPTLFVRGHYPMDTKWLLLNESPGLTEFLNSPLIYGTGMIYRIKPLLPNEFNITTTKGSRISFQFTSGVKDTIEDARLYIEQSPTRDSVTIASSDKGTLYAIDHTFARKGTFAVHIVLYGNHALTYQVNVK